MGTAVIRILILAMTSLINITPSTPFSINEAAKANSIFSKSNQLEPISTFFFKRIPERVARSNGKWQNTSLPARKTLKANFAFAMKSTKPKLLNATGCKKTDYFTKFSYFINVPVVHPFEKYKIIVVTAPPSIKLSAGDTEPLVVYMVFDDVGTDDSRTPHMPEVYFVTQRNGRADQKQKNNEQIWIINSNRTITGLKSKDVAKFVNFRRKRGQTRAWRSTLHNTVFY